MAILSKLGANLAAFFDGIFTFSTATKVTGVVFGGLTIIYIGKVWWSYRFFKRLGLKTPKYRFFYGNLNEVIEKGYSTVFQEWTAQLGKTYGFYEGHYPVLVTSDLELIQEIFIKKYAYFSTRKMSPHISSDNDPSLDLFTSGGEKWKRFRTIMNPTFTSTKVKELIPIMDNCSKRLLDIIENHVNEEITISDYFDRLTMDTIFNCAFGIDIEPQKNTDNIFLTSGIAHFKERAKFNFTMIIIYLFHEFKPYINAINRKIPIWFGGLSKALVPSIFQLYTHIHHVLDERIRKKILIDSCSSDFEDKTQNEYAEFNKMRIQKALSPPEIINHLVLFLLTGFETTASALSYSIFELTKHPDEMHKLQEEIDSFYPPDSDFHPDVESINKLTYLDMFFKEVLRMHPVANGAITRRCVEPITIKNINFPRGLALTVDVLSLHYNEEYWENPYEFNPSRFEPEKDKDINPLVYMPFGIGPRTCIGMRFAQTEVKLLMVKLLRKYDVLATAKTPEKMSYSEGIVRRPKFGVSALFRPRNY